MAMKICWYGSMKNSYTAKQWKWTHHFEQQELLSTFQMATERQIFPNAQTSTSDERQSKA